MLSIVVSILPLCSPIRMPSSRMPVLKLHISFISFSNLMVIGRLCSSCNFFFLVYVSILASRISSMEMSWWRQLSVAESCEHIRRVQS